MTRATEHACGDMSRERRGTSPSRKARREGPETHVVVGQPAGELRLDDEDAPAGGNVGEEEVPVGADGLAMDAVVAKDGAVQVLLVRTRVQGAPPAQVGEGHRLMPAEGIVAAEEHREPVIGQLKARQVEGVGRAQGHGALQLSGRDGPPEIVVVAVNDLDGHAASPEKRASSRLFSSNPT